MVSYGVETRIPKIYVIIGVGPEGKPFQASDILYLTEHAAELERKTLSRIRGCEHNTYHRVKMTGCHILTCGLE